ncbi:YhfC family intramembrane metalloprotease, partial [bacterium]|nr:YhfC family intramembrane metalloprotease [bacterium]
AQIAAYWSNPWYLTLLGALERLFTIPCQIAMAVLVMNAFTRRNAGWLLAAILYHAVLDAAAVIGQQYLSSIQLEGVIGIFALISLLVIFKLKVPEPTEERPEPPAPVQAPTKLAPVSETRENIDDTRFG